VPCRTGLAIASGGFDGIADAGAIDEDALLTVCRAGACEALIDRP